MAERKPSVIEELVRCLQQGRPFVVTEDDKCIQQPAPPESDTLDDDDPNMK